MGVASRGERGPRLSRRRLVASGTVGTAALLALSAIGCTSSGSTGTVQSKGAAGGGPRSGGTLTISHDFQRGFDPHVLQVTETAMMGVFYSQLVRPNVKTYAIEPDLAAKWETPSNTELIFTLAPNVKWHDKPPVNGRPLKTDDILYSLARIQTNSPAFINRSYLSSIARVEAPDDQTIKVTLNQPDVTQLGNLTNAGIKILAPEVVERAGKFATADTVVGTGAFILQNSQPTVGSSLVRNPSYFKSGLPYLDRMELKAFSDLSSEWAAFVAGDLSHRWVSGDQVASFEKKPSGRYDLQWEADTGWHIGMPMTKKQPFNDPRVTRALRLLIDHNEIKSTWSPTWVGRGRVGSFAAATAEVWDLSEEEYGKYLEWKQPKDDANKEATSLLSAAGFTPGKPLKYTLATTTQQSEDALVQLVQDQLKRNSHGAVLPDLKTYDGVSYEALRTNGQFEYYMSGQQVGGVDPNAYFTSTYQTGAGRNYGQMSDPKLDQMIANQRTILDAQQRKQAIRDIIIYMFDNSPYPSLIGSYFLSATQGNVKDFPPEGNTFQWGDHYESVWSA